MRQRVRWLGLGLASLAAACLWYAASVHTWLGQWVDAELTGSILTAFPGALGDALGALARPLLLFVLALVVAGLAVLALSRRRWAAVLAAAVTAGLPAALSPYLRQDVLTRPDLGVSGYAYNTFPSTHASAAFGLLAALLLVWPRDPDRPDVSRAAFLAALVMVGNVSSHAHRAADVVGALLLTCAIAWLAAATFGFKPARPRRQHVRPRSSPK